MYSIMIDNTNYLKMKPQIKPPSRFKYILLLILAGISALACPVLGLVAARGLFIDPRGQNNGYLVLASLASAGLAVVLFLWAQYMKGGRSDGGKG